MKKLIIATNNAGKAREIKAMIEGWEVLSLKDAGIIADVEENGTTFLENAAIKALEISTMTDALVLADDSGLCVNGLDGAPGVYSARYAGDGSDASNNAKLIGEIKNMDAEGRKAHFACAMVIAKNGEKLFECEGKVEGEVIPELKGDGGFGYDPMFYVAELGGTFGEISQEAKNEISHRARALKMAAEYLNAYAE